VSEELTVPIKRKQQWKKFNRTMRSWAKGALAKGALADALDSVCLQRQASHVLVNAPYTSRMDSVTGLLKGKRVEDKFYRENGMFSRLTITLLRTCWPDLTTMRYPGSRPISTCVEFCWHVLRRH
jgi:hypothetical protein